MALSAKWPHVFKSDKILLLVFFKHYIILLTSEVNQKKMQKNFEFYCLDLRMTTNLAMHYKHMKSL